MCELSLQAVSTEARGPLATSPGVHLHIYTQYIQQHCTARLNQATGEDRGVKELGFEALQMTIFNGFVIFNKDQLITVNMLVLFVWLCVFKGLANVNDQIWKYKHSKINALV